MYCRNCGKEIDDKAYVCPNCGVKVSNDFNLEDGEGGFLWGLLGFICPLPFDIILYVLLKSSMPRRMSSFIKGAIIGYAISIGIFVIFFIIWLIAAIFLGSVAIGAM